MNNAFLPWLLLAVLLGSAPALQAQGAAMVLGEEISMAELAAAGDEAAQTARLRDRVLASLIGRYVAERKLGATPAEIAELLAYNREFDRRDRLQRTRKLAELNERLAREGLGGDERTWLEEFRAVLIRLAKLDAENDRGLPADPQEEATFYAPWVEWWKTNKALHEEYGGTVARTQAGPYAQGARATLVADCERRGLVKFLDPRMRNRLFELLAEPPAVVVPPEEVDFTPYWKRPIPPSYFPD